MCGVVGISSFTAVNRSLYDALLMLQHRGQDAAGIATLDSCNQFRVIKNSGLVQEVFTAQQMDYLQGCIGVGHVRYPTSGSTHVDEAQPFYVNSPCGMVLVHNGQLINTDSLREYLSSQAHRHINTTSDSEVLLNILAHALQSLLNSQRVLDRGVVFSAIAQLHQHLRGAYACIAIIAGCGMVAFRDPEGIRPLVLGRRELHTGKYEFMFASESAAFNSVDFEFMRDVAPGEAIYIDQQGSFFSQQCAQQTRCRPCLFEFVYFARPDSCIDGISVYQARLNMGRRLGHKIALEWPNLAIDVVIPVPETACDAALEIAKILRKPYRQGFVKNRYVGRTFIMSEPHLRHLSVYRKLNANHAEFYNRAVLLVDDSIVRGTTSQQIIKMARAAGARKVYFASTAPEVRFPNLYGIDMPTAEELIANRRNREEIRVFIGADGLIFQDLSDLIAAVRQQNPQIKQFETSIFDGHYITYDNTASILHANVIPTVEGKQG